MDYLFCFADNLDFFKLFPEDWYSGIAPYWDEYKQTSSIFTLNHNNKIIAGGIVFNKCSPDMMYNETETQEWLDNGYLYLGFIWVKEEYRNKKMGSLWLKSLMDKFPKQKFWLTVDEKNLISFYEKNGFKLIKSLKNDDHTEWLLTYQPV